MTCKAVVVLQNCKDLLKVVLGSYSETCLTRQNTNEIDVKVEEVTNIQEEEDPMAKTFPNIKAEQEVSCMLVHC
jgi:hypothetical protein